MWESCASSCGACVNAAVPEPQKHLHGLSEPPCHSLRHLADYFALRKAAVRSVGSSSTRKESGGTQCGKRQNAARKAPKRTRKLLVDIVKISGMIEISITKTSWAILNIRSLTKVGLEESVGETGGVEYGVPD